MGYNKIGLWAKCYLDALMFEDKISKEQSEVLIDKIREMILIEEGKDEFMPDNTSSDDLPF